MPGNALKRLGGFQPFKMLLQRCQKNGISVSTIEVQSVDYFRRNDQPSAPIGFVKIKAEATYNNEKIPGIAVLRGDSVGILVLLRPKENPSKVFTALVRQARFPTGQILDELPAGMWDEQDSSFAGSAARELEEECGIKIRNHEENDSLDSEGYLESRNAREPYTSTSQSQSPSLVKLSRQPVLLSPGLLDEAIHLYLYEQIMPEKDIQRIAGYSRDSSDENEHLKVRIVPLESVLVGSVGNTDAKLLVALHLYLLRSHPHLESKSPPTDNI